MPHNHDHNPETCEHCQKYNRRHNKGGAGFFDGVIWGTLIGGILGILYAPMEGKDSRKKLKKSLDEISDRGHEAYERGREFGEEVRDTALPILKEVEEKVGPVIREAMASSDDVQAQVMEKIEELVEDASKAEKKATKQVHRFLRGVKKK